jgi:hypothetical protein
MSVSGVHSGRLVQPRLGRGVQSVPRFGAAGPVPVRRLLEQVDFTAVGASPVKQIALVFSSLITWRLLAANERRRASVSKRWNEMRENLMRDLIGFAFWFLGVPVLQRIYLGAVARRNPSLQGILIQRVEPETKPAKGMFKGLLNWLQSHNPLNNRYIPSSQQVKDQMHQALYTLEQAGLGADHALYQRTQADYLQFIKHRNFATAVGLGSTILLLGVGINLLNFYLTRRNMAANKASKPQLAGATAFSRPVYPLPLRSVGQPAWPGQPGRWNPPSGLPVFQAQRPVRTYGPRVGQSPFVVPGFH